MFSAFMLSAALLVGQTAVPTSAPAETMPALVVGGAAPRGAILQQISGVCTGGACNTACPPNGCAPKNGCGNDCCRPVSDCCNVTWLRPWGCDDLKMECAEPGPCCCGWRGWLFCGKGKDCNGNGCNGDACEKKEEEKADCSEDEDDDTNPLMQLIECRFPGLFGKCDKDPIKIYGWVQVGATFNTSSPNDRLNFGTNFNDYSNGFMANQAPYFVFERIIDHDRGEWQLGGRVDAFFGHDAPNFENFSNSFLANYTGNANGFPGAQEFGFSMPQFYADLHMPLVTEKGVDLRVGRFYTLFAYDPAPAPQTDFYSHTYEFNYNPFTHTGAVLRAHVGDTLMVHAGLVQGWEVVFNDNNSKPSFIGGATWNSCDERNTLHFAMVTGPEQNNNNDNNRSIASLHYTRKFGSRNEWRTVVGGHIGYEENAVANAAGNPNSQDAEWYGAVANLFYTVDPRLILGVRGEYFRDDDAARTPGLLRPNGFAESFWAATFGVTYRPYQNLRLRPEVRFDWANGSRPYNDQLDNFQTTFAMDLIWEF